MFSERLKQTRKFKKLSQKDVAHHLCIDRTTYTNYEIGKSKPTFEKLVEIADFFNVSVDYLLGRTNNPIVFNVTYECEEDLNDYTMKVSEDLSVLNDYMVMEKEDKKAVREFIKARKLLSEKDRWE